MRASHLLLGLAQSHSGTIAGSWPLLRRGRERRQPVSLWQLVPAVDPGDPRWRGHPIWDDIVVRAETRSEAFSVASALLNDPRVANEAGGAPARDLYALRELPASHALPDGTADGTILRVRLRGRR
jgi:hypothetical protein